MWRGMVPTCSKGNSCKAESPLGVGKRVKSQAPWSVPPTGGLWNHPFLTSTLIVHSPDSLEPSARVLPLPSLQRCPISLPSLVLPQARTSWAPEVIPRGLHSQRPLPGEPQNLCPDPPPPPPPPHSPPPPLAPPGLFWDLPVGGGLGGLWDQKVESWVSAGIAAAHH